MLAAGIPDATPTRTGKKGHAYRQTVKEDIALLQRDARYLAIQCGADEVMLPVSQWRHCITNDFEAGVFALHPEIGQIKDALYASGALYASMSGSGSAVYGIFDSVPDGVADRFAGCFCRVMEM